MKRKACVQCGHCCLTGPCSYAEWDPMKPYRCKFLIEDVTSIGVYRCELYDLIKDVERDSKCPMFDCGCSSALCNSMRDDALARRTRISQRYIDGLEAALPPSHNP